MNFDVNQYDSTKRLLKKITPVQRLIFFIGIVIVILLLYFLVQ
jgi:hypothetical protein